MARDGSQPGEQPARFDPARRDTGANRVIDVLLLFSDDRPTLSAATVSSALGLPRSTAYRYLRILRDRGLVEPDAAGYRPGLVLLELAHLSRRRIEIADLALPVMRELARESGETVILTRLVRDAAVCIERVEGPEPVRVAFERGQAMPLHAGAGAKVLLALLDPTEREAVLRRLPLPRLAANTITDRNRLAAELVRIRERGTATSNEEVLGGICAVAAPIFGRHGRVVAGLSIAGPAFRLSGEQVGLAEAQALAAARRISNLIGGTPEAAPTH